MNLCEAMPPTFLVLRPDPWRWQAPLSPVISMGIETAQYSAGLSL